MVYARELGDRILTFGVSGKLIMNALVMYDHQTETLWSQFLSQGVEGPLAGTRLELLPSLMTDWATWRDLHPDTLVLFKGGRYRGDVYEGYYVSGSAGILGEANQDKRLGTKEFVLGLELQGAAKAYPFRYLSETPVVNDTFGGQPLVIFFDPASSTGLVYRRTIEGRTLTLELDTAQDGKTLLVDQETGSQWVALTGEGFRGPLEGKRLERIPTHYAFWFAWSDFHPDTEFYTPEQS